VQFYRSRPIPQIFDGEAGLYAWRQWRQHIIEAILLQDPDRARFEAQRHRRKLLEQLESRAIVIRRATHAHISSLPVSNRSLFTPLGSSGTDRSPVTMARSIATVAEVSQVAPGRRCGSARRARPEPDRRAPGTGQTV